MFTADGYVIFHGANAWREGRFAEDTEDNNGTKFVELIIAAARAGGGYVEYFWDDPTVEGDEDTGSPKVSYALSFTSDFDVYTGQEFIIGAGFYRNFSTAEAETAAEDWLHRFGRSVATQAMEMIGNRVSHLHRMEDHVTVGGRGVDFGFLRGRDNPYGALLDGSSFQVTPGAANGGGGYSLWGGGEVMRFNSGDGEGFGEGEVTTAAVGGDYGFGPLVAGLAVTYSSGSGRFELGRPGDDDFGDVSTTLTSGFPYARLLITDRLLTWGVLGYGSGLLGVEGGGEVDPDSDITMQMAGLGIRGELIRSEAPTDLELAVRADGFIARMHSAEVEGRRELSTDASRARLMFEALKEFGLGAATLQPQLRVGMRQDGGEVDSGFGMEVGGGMSYLRHNGTLAIRLHGRRLVMHQEEEYEEWGLGGSLSVNPGGGGQGLSLGVRPSWGSTASDVTRLWAQGAAGLTAGGHDYGSRRLDAEIGYGVRAWGARGLLTHYAWVVLYEQLGA
ncbi:MAG: hypothetical protein F4187_07505, partial [Gemmatimonadetes bacterium]|nr:hypothetical protein [Gemmatimonadota bacterium]